MPRLTSKCIVLVILACGAAFSQSDTLALSSGVTSPGGTVSLNLTLTAGATTRPAGLQWTLSYSPSAIAAISVNTGPVAAAAGKTISCTSAAGSNECILSGLNTTVIQNGVAAVVTVTIAAGVSTTSIGLGGSFAASAGGGSISLTATGGTITATSPVSLVLFTCNPTVLGPQAASTCTVGLSGPAPTGGLAVAVSDNNSALAVPASVTVAAGNSSAVFQATTGPISAGQTATVTAALNGASMTVSIALVPPLTLSSLACTPTSLPAGTSSTCTVTLNQPSPAGGTVVSLASNTSLLTVPASVTVPSGTSSATFAATAGNPTKVQSFIVTATLNGSSQQVSLTLGPKLLISSLSCNPLSLISGGSATCTVTLSRKPFAGAQSIPLTDNNVLLAIPAFVSVPSGSKSGTFAATAGAVPSNQSATITASLAGSVQTVTLTLAPNAAKPGLVTSVSCTHSIFVAGATARCSVHLAQTAPAGGTRVRLTTSNSSVHVPAFVGIAEGQSSVAFTSISEPSDQDQFATIIAAAAGGSSQAGLTILALRPTSLYCAAPTATAPQSLLCELHLNAPVARSINLAVSASGNAQVPAMIVTRPLQSSLTFEVAVRPAPQPRPVSVKVAFGSQSVDYAVSPPPAAVPPLVLPHAALVIAGAQGASGHSAWPPGSGMPVAERLINAASQSPKLVCSPGSVASVLGQSLDNPDAAADRAVPQLMINGAPAPVLFASAARVDFLCPVADPGSPLSVWLETTRGATPPIATVIQPAAPGIFTVGASSQGMVLFDNSTYATVRSHRAPGFPAQPGDSVSIRATGLRSDAAALVKIGDLDVQVESIRPVDNLPGVYDVRIEVPAGTPAGDAVPVRLQVAGPDGAWYQSNVATMAIELPRP